MPGVAALRLAVAVGGFIAMLVVLALLPAWGQRAPAWAWRFLVAWSLAVPYWHFVDYRYLRDPRQTEAERADFIYLQALSRAVWFGFALLLAVRLLASPAQ